MVKSTKHVGDPVYKNGELIGHHVPGGTKLTKEERGKRKASHRNNRKRKLARKDPKGKVSAHERVAKHERLQVTSSTTPNRLEESIVYDVAKRLLKDIHPHLILTRETETRMGSVLLHGHPLATWASGLGLRDRQVNIFTYNILEDRDGFTDYDQVKDILNRLIDSIGSLSYRLRIATYQDNPVYLTKYLTTSAVEDDTTLWSNQDIKDLKNKLTADNNKEMRKYLDIINLSKVYVGNYTGDLTVGDNLLPSDEELNDFFKDQVTKFGNRLTTGLTDDKVITTLLKTWTNLVDNLHIDLSTASKEEIASRVYGAYVTASRLLTLLITNK